MNKKPPTINDVFIAPDVAPPPKFHKFWSMYADKGGRITIEVNYEDLLKFLSDEGFANYRSEPKEKATILVFIKEKIVEKAKRRDVAEHILKRIKEEREYRHAEYADAKEKSTNENPNADDEENDKNQLKYKSIINQYRSLDKALSSMIGASTQYLKDDVLDQIPVKELKFQRDNRAKAFKYFRNRWVEITAKKMQTFTYGELNAHIWQEWIIDRDMPPIIDTIDYQASDVYRYMGLAIEALRDIDGELVETETGAHRMESLMSTVGYLQSSYKDSSESRAVILVDAKISSTPGQRNGGTGKSLFGKCLEPVAPTVNIAGESLTKKENPFIYSRVSEKTRIIHFRDTPKNFTLDKIYTPITDGLEIEKKGVDIVEVSHKKSPKILVSTNFSIYINGESDERRVHIMEFGAFFNRRRTVRDYIGRELLEDWDDAEWQRFYAFHLKSLQTTLRLLAETGKPLKPFPIVNYQLRQVESYCGDSFINYMTNLLFDEEGRARPCLLNGSAFTRKEIYLEYKKRADNEVTPQFFRKMLEKFCQYFKIHVNLKKAKDLEPGDIAFCSNHTNGEDIYAFLLDSELQKNGGKLPEEPPLLKPAITFTEPDENNKPDF
jgi:hypothetical protein